MKIAPTTRTGWLLVLPLFAFIILTFIGPIALMLARSVYDPELADMMPRTRAALSTWNGNGAPPTAAFDGVRADLRAAVEQGTVGRLSLRLNREQSGFGTLIDRTATALSLQPTAPLTDLDPRWGSQALWQVLASRTQSFTPSHFLNAFDLKATAGGGIELQDRSRRIYVDLFVRTLGVAAIVTILCALLGYPLAHAIARSGPRLRLVLLFIVMLPFWTSLLVRATAWIVLLQRKGVLNEALVASGLLGDNQRLELMYNLTGTVIVMVHVLLPFFVLPLYSVMTALSGAYVRASASLGARPFYTFWRVYLPLTYPGVASGAVLVFVLSLGYYVTPALVGGRTGQLISNQIAFHMQKSLNWGLAAALGSVLLAIVVAIALVLPRLTQRGGLRA
ncbi:ABC transporter permease [Labrys sp. WJW]|uniref:ABC transporter permease n=1 Tax=Labrys sp. WJW TaxID=1737983 RepID=UPI000829D555|nr:ABC transporter permease [Labrys sp. WJW]OCC05421.1 ABC transporter permease [Labrys sp. WJW]